MTVEAIRSCPVDRDEVLEAALVRHNERAAVEEEEEEVGAEVDAPDADEGGREGEEGSGEKEAEVGLEKEAGVGLEKDAEVEAEDPSAGVS